MTKYRRVVLSESPRLVIEEPVRTWANFKSHDKHEFKVVEGDWDAYLKAKLAYRENLEYARHLPLKHRLEEAEAKARTA